MLELALVSGQATTPLFVTSQWPDPVASQLANSGAATPGGLFDQGAPLGILVFRMLFL
jgi:hypothetical protein